MRITLMRPLLFAALGLLLTTATPGNTRADTGAEAPVVQLAQGDDAPRGELRPRYEPVRPRDRSGYNDSYLFAMTRGVADSTMAPAAKVFLYPLTLPLDLILLPFATIGGFFG